MSVATPFPSKLTTLLEYFFSYRFDRGLLTVFLVLIPFAGSSYLSTHLLLVALCFAALEVYMYEFNRTITSYRKSVRFFQKGTKLPNSVQKSIAVSLIGFIIPALYLAFYPSILLPFCIVALLNIIWSVDLRIFGTRFRLKDFVLARLCWELIFLLAVMWVYAGIAHVYGLPLLLRFIGLICIVLAVEIGLNIRSAQGQAGHFKMISDPPAITTAKIIAVILLCVASFFVSRTVSMMFLLFVTFSFILFVTPNRGALFYQASTFAWVCSLAMYLL